MTCHPCFRLHPPPCTPPLPPPSLSTSPPPSHAPPPTPPTPPSPPRPRFTATLGPAGSPRQLARARRLARRDRDVERALAAVLAHRAHVVRPGGERDAKQRGVADAHAIDVDGRVRRRIHRVAARGA